jgi:WhiB family redox-sensing transcriptional regulator
LDLLQSGRKVWMFLAACLEAPAGVTWFPERGEDHRPAKRVCETCPVMYQCRTWSLTQDPLLAGIWGGWSALDRRKWRAQQAAQPEPGDERPSRVKLRGRRQVIWIA